MPHSTYTRVDLSLSLRAGDNGAVEIAALGPARTVATGEHHGVSSSR